MELNLVPATRDDEPFLFEVYASTRAEEMQLVPWDKTQRDAFLRMQFSAQCSSYSGQFPAADYSLIRLDGKPAGRLIVDRSGPDLLLIDIALLPEFRGAGVGLRLMEQLIEEAVKTQKAIKLHVEKFNRALRFYERLGFKAIADAGIYLEMIWQPEPTLGSASRTSQQSRPANVGVTD